MARSCLRCHQRKVRCSKTQPCSACLRLGAPCRYPPVGAETRRARHPKVTIADRVAQLERRLAGILTTSTTSTTNTINSTNHHNHHHNNNNNNNNDNQTTATTSSDDHDGRRNSNNNNHHDHSINNIHLPSDHRRSLALPAEDHTVQSPTQTDPSTGRTPERSRRHEVLVQDGGSTRYINESFLSQILETERGLHKVIETPRDADDALSSFRPEGLLSLASRRPGQQQQNQQNQHQHQHQQHPLSRWQATQLWQTYRANVDPVVKILHLPLVEPLVYSTMNGTESDDCTALLYAIYFAAITSLSDADVVNRLGCDKRSCLLDCQARIETALVDAACLDHPSIRCLQALAIYITCLRAHSSSRSGWIINGVLIRSSLAIGLHRDGTHFDLSPLEAELRRRLWWQILMLDYRAAEDHGLAIQGFGSRADTRLPLHVDDSDLSADLLVLPQPHARWTEMTVFLLTTEIAIAFQKLCQTTAVQPAETTTQRLQTVHELSAYLEQTYLRHCNTNIPIQKAGWLSTRSLLAKLEFFVYQQSLSNDQPLEIVSSTAEQTLAAACTCLEQSVELQTDDLLRGFRWLFASYNQFHCLTYILWHLCAQPTGPQVVRAWNIVDLVFELTEGDPSRPDPGPIWNVLRHLRDKAARGRRGETAVSPAQDRGLFEEAADERGTQDLLSAPDGLGDGLAPNLSLDSNSLAEWMDFSESLGIFRFDL